MSTYIPVILLVCAIGVKAHLTDEQKAALGIHIGACIASSGVNPNIVEKAKKGEFVEDPALNEFLFCLGKRIGFLDEAGDFQRYTIKDELSLSHSGEDVDALIAACTTKTEKTPQLTSLALTKCIYEKSKDHISIA